MTETIFIHVDDDDEDYKVGYAKPPKHSRFKRGKSGIRAAASQDPHSVLPIGKIRFESTCLSRSPS
jgi:hypothetical protein